MEFSLKKEFPDFSSELKELLVEYPQLQKQVEDLQVVERCRCLEKSCSTVYTAPPPQNYWGEGYENHILASKKGMVILDVLRDKIVGIEILDRDDVYKKLNKLMPQKTDNRPLTTDN